MQSVDKYKCPKCQGLWLDFESIMTNDVCPFCGHKGVKPYKTESYGKARGKSNGICNKKL